MAKKVFYSFHYVPDNWRVAMVRNIGMIEGNPAAQDNDWESVTSKGDAAIEKWIADQMYGRSTILVLIGANTAGRKWINHEIIKGWQAGKGVLGIHIHNLLDRHGTKSIKGSNPFSPLTFGDASFDTIVRTYDPPFYDSKQVYAHIATNIGAWIDEAARIRARH